MIKQNIRRGSHTRQTDCMIICAQQARRTMRTLIFAAFLFVLSTAAGHAQDIVEVVTEQWKPFSYEENGVVKGSATKIVLAVLERAGIEYSMNVYPWARSYKTALKRKSVLIFAIVRTEEREPLFKWVGQVAPTDKSTFYKLSRRTDIVVNSLDDAKKYVIGANIDSDKHQFLVKNGFERLSLVSDQALSPKQLFAGHIDLWIMHDINMAALLEAATIPAGKIVKVFTAYESRPYMAFSKGTADDLVAKAVRAYDELMAESRIEKF